MDDPDAHAMVQADIHAADSLYIRHAPSLVIDDAYFEELPTREQLTLYLTRLLQMTHEATTMSAAPPGYPVSAQGVMPPALRSRVYHRGDTPRGHWRLGPAPRYVIGGPGAPATAEFQLLGTVVPMPGGGVAAADINAANIRIFDKNGKHVRTIGRRGGGPGEFDGVWNLWRLADTLIGVDGMGVSQMLTTEGRYIRRLPRPMVRGLRFSPIGYLADGSLVGYVADPGEKIPRGRSTRVFTLFRIARDEPPQAIGRFPGVQVVWEGTRGPELLVYGARMARAVLSDRVCVGFPESQYRFTCLAPDGRPLVEVSREILPGRRVTDEDRQTYFRDVDSTNPTPSAAEYRRQVRKTAVFSGRMPFYGRFLASDSDELWVGPAVPVELRGSRKRIPPESTTWSVYSKEGEWLSDVILPARFELVAVSAGRVIGVVLDPEEGIDKIVAYPLLRR